MRTAKELLTFFRIGELPSFANITEDELLSIRQLTENERIEFIEFLKNRIEEVTTELRKRKASRH